MQVNLISRGMSRLSIFSQVYASFKVLSLPVKTNSIRMTNFSVEKKLIILIYK